MHTMLDETRNFRESLSKPTTRIRSPPGKISETGRVFSSIFLVGKGVRAAFVREYADDESTPSTGESSKSYAKVISIFTLRFTCHFWGAVNCLSYVKKK